MDNFIEQLDFLAKLDTYIEERAQKLTRMAPVDRYESDETKDIASALSKAQGEFMPVGFNRENPYFKSGYADLSNIVKSVRPALTKYALAITQQTIISAEGATILVTRLRHSSGQWIESRCRIIPPKNDPQSYSSTLTYMKRNSLVALLNITVDADYGDDDAEVAMVPARQEVNKGPSLKYNPKDQPLEPITKEQLEELEYELSEYPDIEEEILDKMKLQSLADLPKNKFQISVQRIREIKQLRNGIKS
jgi:hypothetical protein